MARSTRSYGQTNLVESSIPFYSTSKSGSRARKNCAAAGIWSASTNNRIAAVLTADRFRLAGIYVII